jgi:hypothetical protein
MELIPIPNGSLVEFENGDLLAFWDFNANTLKLTFQNIVYAYYNIVCFTKDTIKVRLLNIWILNCIPISRIIVERLYGWKIDSFFEETFTCLKYNVIESFLTLDIHHKGSHQEFLRTGVIKIKSRNLSEFIKDSFLGLYWYAD